MDDVAVYRTCMEKVQQRLAVVRSIVSGRIAITPSSPNPNSDALTVELVSVQFRKTLELIAYSSVAANRTQYSAAHANFGSHYRAKDMLKALRKVNPDFYPVPVDAPVLRAPKRMGLRQRKDGFLTEDEFAALYDASSEVLHMRNPFSKKEPALPATYTVAEWVALVQRLVDWHYMRLSGQRWLVNVPEHGTIQIAIANVVAVQPDGSG